MDYISAHILTDNLGEIEACFYVAMHGVGGWGFDDDTGYFFDTLEEPDLILQEAIDENGNIVTLSSIEKDRALAIASEIYWTRFADGQFN
jgi:hypothetical protein